ncbi:hypothetical protein DVH24_014935, partial [Malus domestica]
NGGLHNRSLKSENFGFLHPISTSQSGISAVSNSGLLLSFDSLLFMNSRTSEASVFSCKSGNKNNLFFVWILFCLLPKFLGTPFAIVNLAIDRCPSRALAVETFG